MLSFAVFDDDGPAGDFALRHAYLVGPDDVPVAAEIEFRAGVIRCRKPTTEAAGLSLQYRVALPAEAGARTVGVFTLSTCLLPERDEPYLLSLELARHQIMQVLNKLEQWGLFDLPAEHPAMRQFEDARHRFAHALVAQRIHNGSDAARIDAERTARAALALAIDAGERLTLIQADRQIRARFSGELYARAARLHADSIASERFMPEGAVKSPDGTGVVLQQPPTLGATIGPANFSEPLVRAATSLCDFVSIPMKWIDLEPSEGKYSYARTDRWIEWAVRQAKVPVVAGPIIDFRPASVPEWLFIWEHDYETLRELVYEHIRQVVTHYRRTVTRWTVASGLHANTSFALSLERMMDLTRMSVLLVRKLQPGAKVQIEISQPFGEYFATNRRSLPPIAYAEMISQAGIQIDALALRLQMGQVAPGRSSRDMMSFAAILDRYAELDKPICVTAVGAPSRPADVNAGEDPGFWRSPWSPDRQSEWLTQAVAIAASKPYVHSVCWQDLYDSPAGDMPAGGLLTDAGAPKPAAARFAEIRRLLQSKQSPASLSLQGPEV